MPAGSKDLIKRGRFNNRFVLARKMIHAANAMSATLNGNGNGNGRGKPNLIRQLEKRAAQAQAIMPSPDVQESRVSFQTSDGVDLSATLTRVTRHAVYFEVYSPSSPLRFSEVLEGFNIILQSECIYSGRATVRNVLDAGTKVMCEATLRETDWKDSNAVVDLLEDGKITAEFKGFLGEWQKFYKISNEFKVVVADMQSFLHDLRLWLERIELRIKQLSGPAKDDLAELTMKQVGQLFVPAFDALHERLEAMCGKVREEFRPSYQAFAQRQLHSLVLCSPFADRAFNKPLGYAGDYEMVNMIARNPFQGESLYAKVVNLWFLSQWPSKAHRNRLAYLKEKLEGETWRMANVGRHVRILNFACGPAIEIQNYLSTFSLSENAEFTLVDFNTETLENLGKAIGEIKNRLALKTSFDYQRKSVNQILKEGAKRTSMPKSQYDFVYCAGLFDYLSDNTCTQMMEVFYDWLAPGGLLAVTNVADEKPFRHMLEFVLDWHLIYRGTKKGAALFPKHIPQDCRSVKMDSTSVNVFIEARKPHDG